MGHQPRHRRRDDEHRAGKEWRSRRHRLALCRRSPRAIRSGHLSDRQSFPISPAACSITWESPAAPAIASTGPQVEAILDFYRRTARMRRRGRQRGFLSDPIAAASPTGRLPSRRSTCATDRDALRRRGRAGLRRWRRQAACRRRRSSATWGSTLPDACSTRRVGRPTSVTFSPPALGRATVYGLLLHATQISGSTLFLPDPAILPLEGSAHSRPRLRRIRQPGKSAIFCNWSAGARAAGACESCRRSGCGGRGRFG